MNESEIQKEQEKVVSYRTALEQILEISYSGHPDGREMRLAIIERTAKRALGK